MGENGEFLVNEPVAGALADLVLGLQQNDD